MFLVNHKEAIAAMDFFTVPTIPFGILYFFVIAPIAGGSRIATSPSIRPGRAIFRARKKTLSDRSGLVSDGISAT